jgi:hypothetical protein
VTRQAGAGPRPLTRQRSPWERADDEWAEVLVALEEAGGVGMAGWRRRVADGRLRAIVGREPLGPAGALRWHLSISHVTGHDPPRPGRYPTWDEIAHARYPADRTFALLLPPAEEYVAAHPTTFHLHELRPEET